MNIDGSVITISPKKKKRICEKEEEGEKETGNMMKCSNKEEKIQGHRMPANLRVESKETNGTQMDADEMQRRVTSQNAMAP